MKDEEKTVVYTSDDADSSNYDLDKNNLLMSSIIRYFQCGDHMETMMKFQSGNTKLSLRLLDWLITNYSKTHNVIYNINVNGVTKSFNMYLNYKTQLKAFSKKQFDPFQRRDRIRLNIKNQVILTTVGQLNFFKWAIQNNVIDFAEKNIQLIENDMNQNIQNRKSLSHNKRKKRHSNTTTIIQMCNKECNFS